jgi:hypothetical protein
MTVTAVYLHLFLQDYFYNLFTASEMASSIKAGYLTTQGAIKIFRLTAR